MEGNIDTDMSKVVRIHWIFSLPSDTSVGCLHLHHVTFNESLFLLSNRKPKYRVCIARNVKPDLNVYLKIIMETKRRNMRCRTSA